MEAHSEAEWLAKVRKYGTKPAKYRSIAAQAFDMWNRGLEGRKIASVLGVSHGTVQRALRGHYDLSRRAQP